MFSIFLQKSINTAQHCTYYTFLILIFSNIMRQFLPKYKHLISSYIFFKNLNLKRSSLQTWRGSSVSFLHQYRARVANSFLINCRPDAVPFTCTVFCPMHKWPTAVSFPNGTGSVSCRCILHFNHIAMPCVLSNRQHLVISSNSNTSCFQPNRQSSHFHRMQPNRRKHLAQRLSDCHMPCVFFRSSHLKHACILYEFL